jgi:signal transduction histidine kinase
LTGPASEQVLRELRGLQLNTVFRQMPTALAVNIVNAAITAVVLQRLAGVAFPLTWFCVVLLVTIGRSLLWLRYRRASSRDKGDPQWRLLTICGSLLAGLCWGLGGMALFPSLPVPAQMFLTVVIGGMCAGAVVTSSSHLPTFLAFLLSATLPMAVLFFRQDTITGSALGAMILVFAAALSLAGRHLNGFVSETMRLRFELGEANLRLQAEIAERETAEAALRQAQKFEAIGQLTGGIAHDFNNLLTIVIGNLNLAIGRTGKNSAVMPLLRSALHAAERGGASIQRLLAFARKQRLDPQPVDLGTLVTGIEELLHRTLGDRTRLTIVKSPNLAPALVDANQLELAILNLTINARDAMPSGGILRIDLQNRRTGHQSPPELPPGDYVVVSISDTGTGMDAETLARAFEPFFTTKKMGSGSGLGLPMVQGFAAQSEGIVRIRSTLGVGTTVELWLPRADETDGYSMAVAQRRQATAGSG